MHSASAFAILFALGAVAVPSNRHAQFHQKRDNMIVMTTEVVQETVTVGPNGNPAPSADSKKPAQHEVHILQVPSQPQAQPEPQQQAPPPQQQHQQAPPQYQAPPPQQQHQQAPPPPAPAPQGGSSGNAPSGYDSNGDQAPSTGTEKYQQAALMSHNCHRSNHSAPDVKYDQSLANAAKQLATRCNFAHDTSIAASSFPPQMGMTAGYGQNIAAGTNDDDIAGATSDQWYNGEIMGFPFNYDGTGNPIGTQGDVGHVTQLIWKGTTHIGCASHYCPSMLGTGATFHVCNYGPPGNVQGHYPDNLSPSDHSQGFTKGT